MRVYLFFGLLILVQTISAQTFTEITVPQFLGVDFSSIAFVDVDGDSDQDVLITGRNNARDPSSKLYINDGIGNFTEATGIPFEGVERGSIAFADVDGDNDQDVLITGFNGSSNPDLISKLYINDGMGTFIEATNTPFEGADYSSIAFADVDGDNDQDVLITGRISQFVYLSKLYINDGMGTFTGAIASPFDSVWNSSIAFADVDGDNDPDVLITGLNNSGMRISKLYTNDGMGTFTETVGTPFEGVQRGSIAFADVDGDNDQDVLITGLNSSLGVISKLYTNDGMGTFTEDTANSFEGVERSSIAFADVDGDNDQDVLITGSVNPSIVISKLYTNNGMGTFTEATSTFFEGVSNGSIAFADVDGDNDQDVLFTGAGANNFGAPRAKLYTNDGTTSLVERPHKIQIVAFPNPSSGEMTIQSAQVPIESVSLYDLTGRRLPAEIIHDGHEAQVRSSYRGLAIVKVQTEQGMWVQKVRME